MAEIKDLLRERALLETAVERIDLILGLYSGQLKLREENEELRRQVKDLTPETIE